MLKKIAFATLTALIAASAWAACTTTTIFGPDGKVIFCTTCCSGQNCTTTCI